MRPEEERRKQKIKQEKANRADSQEKKLIIYNLGRKQGNLS